MEENKKNCPFCGAEINKDAKKCRFCGNWIDEEIQCPYCAEKIKASAKKCRFCGEWLNPDDKKDDGETNLETKDDNKTIDVSSVKSFFCSKLGIAAICAVIALALIISVISYIMYIPSCKNSGMHKKLQEYLTANYTDIENIALDKKSAHKLKRIEKGYSCSINATIDETPTQIEYSYKKVAFNEFDINAKFVLPNCYDSAVKDILKGLIKKSEYYNIKDNISDVTTKYEKQEEYDKDAVAYKCSAEAELNSKPGKAFMLNSWDYDDASRKMKCKVDYKSYFCENGYTTCVGLTDLYACEYEDD